jgi:hypothetical protein
MLISKLVAALVFVHLKTKWRANAHGFRTNFCVHLDTQWRANAPVAALMLISKQNGRQMHMVSALIFVFFSKQNGGQMHLLQH